MHAKFLVALLQFPEDEVGCREVGNHIVVCLGYVTANETMKGAVVGLPDIMCFGMEGGVRLRESPF